MSTTFPTANPKWDLESIFEGGVESQAFSTEVQSLEKELGELNEALSSLKTRGDGPIGDEILSEWRDFFDRYFSIVARMSEAGSFSRAIASTHTDEPKALRMPSRLDDARTALGEVRVGLLVAFGGLDDEVFSKWVEDERFSDMTLWLRELRRDADRAMGREAESLAVELNRDGLHGWGRLYSELSGRLEVTVEIDGEKTSYSVAQAKNLLDSPERRTRRAAFEGLQQAWGEAAPVCASALNSIRGTEQTYFRRRGGDHLTKALDANRVQRSTVEAMMEAAAEFRPVLVRYLKAKAKWLGLETLDWYDLKAPMGAAEDASISYEDAQQFIVEQVAGFSPKIAEFCQTALSRQWVEAEDRSGKRQGGYCTSLPVSKEIRIFMTYGGTNSGVTTLAHELGHGYHGMVLADAPVSERRVPMGLAETASTFLEAIVEQAALKRASESQRLALLDDRLGRAATFLMNLPARYRLEIEMHQHRAEGTLHEELLRDVTREVFQAAYGEGLATVDELFWASKAHFFITGLPFYNFPYTFGYLFSRAVYERAMEADDDAVRQVDALLQDTGRLSSEDVAEKHLDADLSDPGFWKTAAGSLVEDVERFEALVAQ